MTDELSLDPSLVNSPPHGEHWPPDLPHDEWDWLDCYDGDDRGLPRLVCGMCGHPDIRYRHILSHPTVPGEVEVGCCCAAKLTDRSKKLLQTKEARLRRELTFIRSPRWRDAKSSGRPWVELDGHRVTLYPARFYGDRCGVRVYRMGDPQWGEKDRLVLKRFDFETEDDAKRAAFRAIVGG